MCETPSTGQGWLSDDTFRQVVANTPLVSLDFVVTNPQGEWLLGQRVNRPAQGCWFVPGGRVRKSETLEAAAQRLTRDELGQASELADLCFLGVYQHFYADSTLDPEHSTHYVVLAYQLMLEPELETLPRQQHCGYRWWSPHAIVHDETVHANTRAYLPAVQS
ncbi:GDP-mannose mannosyl hydrolase [Halomonas saccharevitans]|uniref:Colanic acid biosynthesis protein WcaH n=1 Tax=Halomonas saccharevitans TaxID=416872 RepID=A0A1I7B3S4_9GAMM|nr:GDP-mannose mannosyl hydrolase [Halomonas saccharevitans]SFT81791.1 colanic acid biosynthesis protein WcaH [Halomonas saccharevitans]